MEPLAIEWGIPSDKYWSLTFLEIMNQVQANKKRHELESKERAIYDYKQAQILAYAFNSPEKMPSPEKMYPILEDKNKQEQTVSQDRIYTQEEMLKEQALFRMTAEGAKRAIQEKNKES